jgi:hypothetical protein
LVFEGRFCNRPALQSAAKDQQRLNSQLSLSMKMLTHSLPLFAAPVTMAPITNN